MIYAIWLSEFMKVVDQIFRIFIEDKLVCVKMVKFFKL